MRLEFVKTLVSEIASAIPGANIIFNDYVYRAYEVALRRVPHSLYYQLRDEVYQKWEKRYMPPPPYLKQLAEGLMSGMPSPQDEREQREAAKQREAADARFRSERKRYEFDINDLIKRTLNDQHMNDEQLQALEVIMPYMDNFHNPDPKEGLKDEKSPYYLSFTGLYICYKKGKLDRLKDPDKNDLFKSRPEPEKERQRQRSLDLEKKREDI